MFRTLAIVAFLVTPTLTSAQVYQWTDDQGNTHFSDEAPEGGKVTELEQPNLVNSPLPPTERRQSMGTQSANDRPSTSPGRAPSLESQKHRCNGYRQRKEDINQRLRSGYREPTGNRLRRERRELRTLLYREC